MIVDDRIEKYIESHTDKERLVLHELYRETNLSVLNPRMLSGHYQGNLLSFISKMLSPSNILEIGTYTGYSAICLASELPPDGVLHTVEINDELEEMAQRYFTKAGVSKQIIQHIGDACKIIPTLNVQFDLIFIDGDKKQYIEYYNLCIDKLRRGGVILVDNVLWSGKVVEPIVDGDKDTPLILAFNQMIAQDDRVEKIILPIRDGIYLIRKK